MCVMGASSQPGGAGLRAIVHSNCFRHCVFDFYMARDDQRYRFIVHMQLEDMGPVCWPALLGLADKQMAFVR